MFTWGIQRGYALSDCRRIAWKYSENEEENTTIRNRATNLDWLPEGLGRDDTECTLDRGLSSRRC